MEIPGRRITYWNPEQKKKKTVEPRWAKQQTRPTKINIGAIIEFDAQPTGVQLKKAT